MSTLAAFAAARLLEDEARSWAIHDIAKCDALLYEEDMAAAARRDPGCDCGHPARIRREVAAKRQLIDISWKHMATIDAEWGDGHGADEIRQGMCPDETPDSNKTLRALAAVYSDHPDYDQAWRPE